MESNLKSDLIRLVRELSYEKRDVVLSSGQKSNFYIDMKQTLLNAKGIYIVSKMIAEKLKKHDGKLKGVGGITMGADPISTGVSLATLDWRQPLHAFYIRKEAKGHGTAAWVEGMKNFRPNDSVYILEDVTSTGGSSLKAVERARDAKLNVEGVITCVDREMGGLENIKKEGVSVWALLTKSEIEDFA